MTDRGKNKEEMDNKGTDGQRMDEERGKDGWTDILTWRTTR
jgi:hypothetical protein